VQSVKDSAALPLLLSGANTVQSIIAVKAVFNGDRTVAVNDGWPGSSIANAVSDDAGFGDLRRAA